ncbi:alpha/beta fold hydrolase [Actinopolymorpha rutila]|uniref:Pimeloyl-ACP methyl ester carboxylesterase n=1 Tax=Actinopolymorpha rutila TaxID=446787 RepID=A0A852Z741_9ACTN|nr:alpha/beta hydrolase [Actinopolymorpha rutila]NYH88193.1 pimeloyl-ACP methyl ester carboxylesterase [Actinopolymorpha rutila]
MSADPRPAYVLTGAGRPTTVFAPGLGGSVEQTRPFGSGVRGTRAFLEFHGGGEVGPAGSPGQNLTYADLAADVRRIAGDAGATRAVGVSLGAGAILHLLAATPDRFERLVLLLPAALDRPRPARVATRMRAAAERADRGDVDAVAAALRDLQPGSARDRPDVVAWSQDRARALAGPAFARVLRAFADQKPLADRGVLARCTAPVLVVGQEGDDAHPADVARETAAALPNAELEVFPPGGLLWEHRSATRARISAFLNGAGGNGVGDGNGVHADVDGPDAVGGLP